MKKTVLMSAAKKARIALAVMAVFGMSFVGARSVFAADATEHPVKIDVKNNIVCGTGAKAEKATGSTVDPANDIVIGVNAIANDKNSIAIGTGANAKAENSVAIGYGSVADAADTISFGSAANYLRNKRLVNLAAGKDNNDAATYGQVITSVKQNGNKLEFYTGTNTTSAAMDVELYHPVKFEGSNLIGGSGAKVGEGRRIDTFSITSPNNNVVLGNKAQANGEYNVVMGVGAIANNYRSIVIGESAKGDVMSVAMGAFAEDSGGGVAIGYNAKNKGTAAIGNSSKTDGFMAIAIGGSAKATNAYTIAMSFDSEASKENAMAFGYSAKAIETNTIALGAFSEASKGNNIAIGYYAKATGHDSIAIRGTASGYDSKAFAGTASGDYSIAIGGKANGNYSVSIGEGSVATDRSTVSVGSGVDNGYGGYYSAPGYRRIVNMADGIKNHDAATYGQILKKDNYTISLDSTGTGQAVLKTNADNDGPTIKVDASALETQITKNASDITAVDGKIGTLSADGTYIKKAKNVSDNLVALDTQVKRNADDITIAKDTIHNVSNKIGTKYDGNYIHAVNPIGSDLVALDKQVKVNADAITTVDNKIGSMSADGTYIKKANNVSANLVELDKQVNANATALTNKANLDLSNINADGETRIKELAKTEAGTVLTGELGTITSTNYVSASGKVNENISKLDTQVKANADDIIAANTKITNVDNKIGSLSTDGTYIKKTKNVSDNLVELDNQVNANATALTSKANLDLSNITVAGETKIKDLASIKAGEVVNVKLGAITSTHYVSTGNTVNANISALDTQLNKVDNKIGTMTDGNYIVAGNTVAGNLSALDNQLKANTDAIAEKADKNLSNITDAGKNVIKDLAGNKAGEVVADKLGTITSNNYVSAGNTVNANISKLDEQVKANADAINTKADKDLSNITDAGKNVIKDLAGNKAGEVVDAKLGDITSNNYVNAGNTVNANISALDKQMKVNTDNIGDTNKLTTAGLGSNLSDAVVKVNDKVGDTSKLTTANLGNNLSDAVVKVDDKTKQNAKDIEKVNGRVDELGGRVDTIGGAVAKLDSRVNKVGAGAAALAALHPMEFDSDNKLSFAAGVGNYRGTNAAAIGAFYRPSEQVMFSISGNMGNGENMVNAGVSFALDRPSKTPTTKAALVKTVVAQNEQIAALNETLAEQSNALEAQSREIAELKAMVQKLAAKQNA
ncbi:YadA-like family protein [Phascolarctobacterium succinatutens]|uniref:YadA-like family protein n=1 Tax=Phascolarctobacterium succinatutens TaxID=626940 RepID=UPI0026EF3492|nr:YadA-like family protein [Phascolarctobacterium succinatutens]